MPAALAIGNVSLGKTKSAEAALSLVGMNGVSKVKSITDSQALKYSAMTTLGMIIDDPSKPGEIAESCSITTIEEQGHLLPQLMLHVPLSSHL